eukprot:CAMPEP_0203785884 /NCGR_PEP_ID=MMETSP0100_2-20121128/1285_1 /ASSEMBLY_ACC=CAM_ASM_000210 /TAXON_ID=96639 /ORGANISM=" , Strain NY0313808BC1" /LENGTH=38 /DNA_ID= /DNA_START= /DNA_END= /DNA_ORIENTATION=
MEGEGAQVEYLDWYEMVAGGIPGCLPPYKLLDPLTFHL